MSEYNTVPTVFIVDDDDLVLQTMMNFAKGAGHSVEGFVSAEDFLRAYNPDRPGCLVLDFRMPGMNGLELQETLSGLGTTIPIILISGYANIPTAVRSVRMGAIDVLEKPLDKHAFLKAIKKALEQDAGMRIQNTERRRVSNIMGGLTEREQQVLKGVIAGNPNKIISARLGLSDKTIEYHRARIMRKFNADSLAELVRLVLLTHPE